MPPLLWADFPPQYVIAGIALVVWIIRQVINASEERAAAAAPTRREPMRMPAPSASSTPSRRPTPPSGSDEGDPRGYSTPEAMRGDTARTRASGGVPTHRTRPRPESNPAHTRRQNKPRPAPPEPKPEAPRLTDQAPGRHDSSPSVLSGGAPRTLAIDKILAMLNDPSQIQNAILLNEILQPPLSVRQRSRPR